MSECVLCPRKCRADRECGQVGYCGVPAELKIARAGLHLWEEPCLSGKRGAGAVFFSGCNLRCGYCQNYDVSHAAKGYAVSDGELYDIFARLVSIGAENIDLVTPDHYTDRLIPILKKFKEKFSLPIVWNSGGYASAETLRRLSGLVDIYLPDFKYADSALAGKFSGAPDYPEVAQAALTEMFSQVGRVRLNENGKMLSGLIVRHLVLPGYRQQSMEALRRLASFLPVKEIYLSLMSQYTPAFASHLPEKNMRRKVTAFEYQTVLDAADELGFEGYSQKRSSAERVYTPAFFSQKPEGDGVVAPDDTSFQIV